jgi:hypothetical protein
VTDRTWLALVDGRLQAWRSAAKPERSALRVDPRVVDFDGPAATVSLVLPPRSWSMPFDDPAVQQARRALIAGEPFDAVSTLMRDWSSFAGSLLVTRGPGAAARLAGDPFARVHPARVLEVDAGLLAARVPWPVGPVIERYGSNSPWPVDVFPT